MGEDSNIAWTDHTYNPWIGCTKVGIGCEGCYAEAWDKRFLEGQHWGAGKDRHLTSRHTRNNPLRWDAAAQKAGKPAKVFAHSLSDVFDNEVPQEWRAAEFLLWRMTPWLRWIVLTKRPGNIAKMLPADWSVKNYPNVGFCCSVSNQEEFDRDVAKLVNQTEAAWLGVSIEPQVGPVHIPYSCDRSIQWIITGGASAQPGYFPPVYRTEWVIDLMEECRAAGIALFVKQLGSNAHHCGELWRTVHKAGADPTEWPSMVPSVRQFPTQLLY